MLPAIQSLPVLEALNLGEGSANKPSSEASVVTDDDSAQNSSNKRAFSGRKRTQNKDIKYVLSDGYRTVSFWENPLLGEPDQSNVRGKGRIIDIYILSKAGGSEYWLDYDKSTPKDIETIIDIESEGESEIEDESEDERDSKRNNKENSSDRDDDTTGEKDDQRQNSRARSQKTDQERSSFSTPRRRRAPGFIRRSAEVVVMHIHSSYIKGAIRSLITYYPTQILTGKFIAVETPFKMLWHCYHDLHNIVEGSPARDGPSNESADLGAEINDIATRNQHITVLLEYLKPQYMKMVKPAEERHLEGVCSYETLWLLFKPGCDVYARVGGDLAGFVLSSTKEDSTRFTDRVSGDERWEYFWTVKAWNLSYKSGEFVRTTRSFKITKFEGEKEITSLAIFPSKYLDSYDKLQTRQKLERRGEAYFEFARKVPIHLGYQGSTWGHRTYPVVWKKEPKLQYEGEIIIDPAAFQRYASESPATASRGDGAYYERRRYVSASYSSSEVGNQTRFEDESRWLDYENIDPKSPAALTKHYYFLVPRRIDGFALKQKRWMGFDIEGIKLLQWSPDETSAMNQLILPRRDIEIIKALSSKHAVGNTIKWGADFIPGKGEGQVFLLHGPPGTGKTYTVECVADYTRRPLVCLTVADIGTDEVRMESNLSRWFTVAASWQAIILIDEADVFLERRQGANLQRNSLVSVFLRCMEYYPGMLFLTTNRIGQIDDAFLSRTSVALTYEPLSASVQLRIWDGFLSKLERERSDVIVTDRARTFLEEDEDMTSIPWNGREIRNALQTAIALAMYDNEQDFKKTGKKAAKVEVDKEHFLKVVLRRKTFIEYRDSIRRQNEEQRALGEGSRALPKRT